MKFLSIRSVIGLLGLVIAGALAGLAAGVNVVTDIGLVDPKAFGITVLVIGIVGALGGMSIGLATFCRRERDSSQKAMSMLVKLEMAQVAWVLLTAGASLPYLAVVVSTAPYLSQIPIVKLGGVTFSHIAGLAGTLLWVDGVVMQFVLAYRILREYISLF